MFTEEEKKELKDLAYSTLTHYLDGEKQEIKQYDNPSYQIQSGLFVTIKKKGELRGCKGRLESDLPLYETLQVMTIDSATNDPRFAPISPQEKPELSIELSILSPFEKCTDPTTIEVGKHGLIIQHGVNSGLLLPQVPVEWGWDRDTFLIHTCRKAGLPDDAWTYADLKVFEAEVF